MKFSPVIGLLILSTSYGAYNVDKKSDFNVDLCGPLPRSLSHCINIPTMIKDDISQSCVEQYATECDIINCIFEKMRWKRRRGKIYFNRIITYYKNYAERHAEWQTSIEQMMQTCFSGRLEPQGVNVNCPAADILHCSFTAFLKNAPEDIWSKRRDCAHVRRFVETCPICPEDCFLGTPPEGSCNACAVTEEN